MDDTVRWARKGRGMDHGVAEVAPELYHRVPS